MARGSKPGERRGGRQKGTPNKRTNELKALADKAREGGISPLDMILTTARDLWREANAGSTPNIGKRMQAVAVAEKVMPYLHPRLSSVEMNASVRRSIQEFSEDELAAIAGEDGGEG